MTNAQKRFCDEYLVDLNATRAYKVAYPNVKKDHTATVNGNRLLTFADIKNYIDEELEKIQTKKVATIQEIMEYLTSTMRGETESEIVVVEGTGDGCSEARTITKAPDEKEKLKAAELLGKRFGMFTDKVDITGGYSVELVDDVNE